MQGGFFIKFFHIYFFVILILLVLLSSITLFSTFIHKHYNLNDSYFSEYYFSSSDFFWPTPGYHQITSYFGPRNVPTTGASSNHSGIDIAAQEGSSIYSVSDGIVIHTGFKGAYGHTIIVKQNNLEFLYAHVSPFYIVNLGQYINANSIIGNIGPKILNFGGNSSYTDSFGNFTNGATTGPHLHLTIKKDGIAVNPLLYFNKD